MPHKNSPLTAAAALLALALTLCAVGCAIPGLNAAPLTSQLIHPCGPLRDEPPITPALEWTPDGAMILFSKGNRLYTVASDGSALREIARAGFPINPADGRPPYHYGADFGLYADVSPDGSRIVYATCEYMTEPYRWHHDYTDAIYEELVNYEIAIAEIDGSDKGRLTENLAIDHYPAWSPDGNLVAFVSNARRNERGAYGEGYYYVGYSKSPEYTDSGLYVMNSDGTEVRSLTPTFYEYSPHGGSALFFPPRWSPDGERVAFIGYHPEAPSAPYTLYTATTDGLNLRTIAGAAGAPSWSPDGQRLAFMANDGNGLRLRLASADGGYIQDVAAIEESVNGFNPFGVPWATGGVSWSPNGSAFIINAASKGFIKAFVIGDDGSELQSALYSHAEWSPDGKRIAVMAWYGIPHIYYYGPSPRGEENEGVWLYTVSPDGSERRNIVMIDRDGEPKAANPK